MSFSLCSLEPYFVDILCLYILSYYAKNRREKTQSRHRALFIPKEGKEMLEVNLEKGKEKTRSRNQILGSGVDYAKGRC